MYKVINALLTPNIWSRSQKPLVKVKALVIHWVANPMSTAMGNRDYFEQRKYGKLDYGSAHEVIDLNGDVVVCVPSNEITYNCGSSTYTTRCISELGTSPNYCTYGIECTHIDWTGKMKDFTYNTLVERCADLCIKFKLEPLKNLWTHQEVVGWKDCHRFFVNNPAEWKLFKQRVQDMFILKKFDLALQVLVSKGIINSPDYWRTNAVIGKTVQGEYAGAIITRSTQTTILKTGVDILVSKGLINSPTYWMENAIVGKLINGEYLQTLIIRIANMIA